MTTNTQNETAVERIKAMIRDVPDFPKKGIMFKDITPLLADNQAFTEAVKCMATVSVGIHAAINKSFTLNF